jgi:iron complex outermembrane receptor protein
MVLVLLLLGTFAAWGQAEKSEEAASDAEQGEGSVEKKESFEEFIVVTAQKREENVMDVPASVVAISSAAIEEAGVVQVRELSEMIPNFDLPNRGTDFGNRITIRGVGAHSRNIGFDTRVGVYLDGVYLGQSPALNMDLYDLERIEVLRGPQGTLYGKNSVAGALNLVTKEPTDAFSGNLGFKVGELGSREASVLLNGPLSERVRGRISILHHQQDGYIRNSATGTDLMDQCSTSYRGQLLLSPSDSVSVKVSVDGLSSDRFVTLGEPTTDTFGLYALDSPPFETAFNLDPWQERSLVGGAVTVDRTGQGGGVFRSISGYRDSTADYVNDTDYSTFDYTYIDYRDSYSQFSQEFQWLSPQVGNVSYVMGAYLYGQEGKTRRDVPLGQDVVLLGPPEVTGLLPGNVVSNSGTVDTESYAVFGEMTWMAGDRSTVGLGVRVSNEKKSVDWILDGSQSGYFGIGTAHITDSRSATNVSPALNWLFNATEHTNVYLRAATGFKSGGYNLDFVTDADLEAGIEFDDETVLSFEAGLKGRAKRGRLIYTVAIFDSTYDDYQVNQFLDLGGGATSITIRNAAEVTTRGGEADLTYRGPSGLEINTALGLLDAEFVEFPGGGLGGSDASGNVPPYAPESSFTFGVGKTWLIGSSIIMARADYHSTGSQYTSVANVREQELGLGGTVPYGWLDATDTVNGRIGFISKGGKYEVHLWGRNLTDEHEVINFNRDFFGTITELRPRGRTIGTEVSFNF